MTLLIKIVLFIFTKKKFAANIHYLNFQNEFYCIQVLRTSNIHKVYVNVLSRINTISK